MLARDERKKRNERRGFESMPFPLPAARRRKKPEGKSLQAR
jgi:hypothetical protein